MNFFEHQDRARKKTGRLIVLFALAVIMILIAVNAAAYGIMRIAAPHAAYMRDAAPVLREDHRYPPTLTTVDPVWQRPQAYVAVTAATLLIIAGGSLYKTAALSSGGGAALAQSLGGRPVVPESSNPQDRMLQNVVEEMSIASGVPVPRVFVMENVAGINAFAAGLSTEDAVIGVTRGSLERLNRDELQGVVAHEFSHILNGDMRLNLRLIGLLHGILVIALLGYAMLRIMQYSRISNRRSSDRNGGGNAIILIALAGAAMLVIGYVGVFFGRLIQAAVSRQREFLADASAVQFTRNPAGLVGALRKIGIEGSRIGHHNAVEAAHLFFGSASGWGFARLLATHPPLDERIRAIDPIFAGKIQPARDELSGAADPTAPALSGFAPGAHRVAVQPQSIVNRAGSISPGQVRYAHRMVEELPAQITSAAHDPFGARALVFALLLSDHQAVRARQLEVVRQGVEPAAYRQTAELAPIVAELGFGARLPLFDVALPALRQMSPEQMTRFKSIVRALIGADERVSLFEFALAKVLDQNLRLPDERARRPVQYWAITAVMDEAAMVLSALAAASSRETDAAYAAGARRLDPEHPPALRDSANLASLNTALAKLAHSSPAVKQRLIDAAAHVVAADGTLEIAEAEMLRAVAATLDVPLPPLVSDDELKIA